MHLMMWPPIKDHVFPLSAQDSTLLLIPEVETVSQPHDWVDHQALGGPLGVDPSLVLAALWTVRWAWSCAGLRSFISRANLQNEKRLRTGKRKGEGFMSLQRELQSRPGEGRGLFYSMVVNPHIMPLKWVFCHHLKMHIMQGAGGFHSWSRN